MYWHPGPRSIEIGARRSLRRKKILDCKNVGSPTFKVLLEGCSSGLQAWGFPSQRHNRLYAYKTLTPEGASYTTSQPA